MTSAGPPSPGSPIPPALLATLRCPRCGKAVTEQERAVTCGQGHEWSRSDGYLDASPPVVDEATARTFGSFGYEWTRFDEVRPEDEEFWKDYFADVPLEEIKGRVGLDAGCGKGRYTRFTAAHLEAVLALDGSDAIRVAARHLADLPNALAVKADLRHAPVAPESFGFVSCLGVLHHLGDPEEGFRALVRLLAPGGILLVYLYSRPEGRGLRSVGLHAASGLRRLTTRMPHPALRLFSMPMAGVLYGAVVVPGALGDRFRFGRLASLPLASYRGKPVRSLWLDTFDRLSAPIERRYTWSDVEPWFRRARLDIEAVHDRVGLTIVARRPPASASPELPAP